MKNNFTKDDLFKIIESQAFNQTPFDFEIIKPPIVKRRFMPYFFYRKGAIKFSKGSNYISKYNNIVVIVLFSDVSADYYIRKMTKTVQHYVELAAGKNSTFYDDYFVLRKEIAALAGLGKIGKNGLFFSRKFGFNCKIDLFYTNLDFNEYPEHDYNYKLSYCENCNSCINSCPRNAIDNYRMTNVMKCARYIDPVFHIPEKMCRNCITSCPNSEKLLSGVYEQFKVTGREKGIWLEHPSERDSNINKKPFFKLFKLNK